MTIRPCTPEMTLTLSRKEGGRGLASIEDSVDATIQRLEDSMGQRGGKLMTATRTDDTNRKQKWKEKWTF